MTLEKTRRITKEIRLIKENELSRFFAYLNEQVAENGQGDVPLFQPMSRKFSAMSEQMKQRFSDGITRTFSDESWRKLWIAIDEQEQICGHIDLRPLAEPHTDHRALLGMGVHSDARRTGLGKKLIETVAEWAKEETDLQWIDLWVMSNNVPAISLYQKTNFIKNGEIEDMFRIDGSSYSYVNMSLKL
ncbi:acetyltransferase, ribosomal protein N-acetylase [Shewanella psychrophila]|uniref:Acetyltransferase, ribosomal protein N-acetylase n=1 Tax=Shewanella psychrophila TaxID=225848 RepID=A0A1S6HW42_9GAMM|nr:GNAT family N-acetyltransferase [Shewanella psychrophila]AQS39692.1 acetyltransferase, ribosomal protein N-acetylase [Shewanella psychrophila]